MSEAINNYFPHLGEIQKEKLSRLKSVYEIWNSMINVISRKDMENFEIHHLLHSLSLARIIDFVPGTRVLDVGTGGGFPGIPLAIIFPETEFTLLDSIEKKIKVVSAVKEELSLHNVIALRKRAEEEKGRYDFVVSRAVTDFPRFVTLISKNIKKGDENNLRNGIICLKGGDLKEELSKFRQRVTIWNINEFFTEPFFETKRIVYLPV